MSVADVVVVGGGHNGLACAAYLAKAGRRVVVVESQGVLGGLSSTEETVKEAPGFLMNTGALDMVFSNSDQSVIDELNLTRYGLRVAIADPGVHTSTPMARPLRCGAIRRAPSTRSGGSRHVTQPRSSA